MIERVECPADPEVLFDVGHWRTESIDCDEEKIQSSARRCGNGLSASVGSRGVSSEAEGSIKSRRNDCIQMRRAEHRSRRSLQ
jgi:hypothetical protein